MKNGMKKIMKTGVMMMSEYVFPRSIKKDDYIEVIPYGIGQVLSVIKTEKDTWQDYYTVMFKRDNTVALIPRFDVERLIFCCDK